MNAPKPMPEPFSTDLPAASSVGKPIERIDCRARKNWGPVLLCLLGVVGFAVLLRTQHLSDISLHFDECCSWKISQFPWHEMLDAVSRDAHPPLYYVLMKGMGLLGAHSSAALRGVSVFWGVATVGAAFWFVRTSFTEVPNSQPGMPQGIRDLAAMLAAALVAAGTLHVEMSMQARPYTLGTFLTLLSGGLLLRAVRPTGTVLDWFGFAAAATALSLTHYYCLFTVAALFLFGAEEALRGLWREGWSSTTKRILAGLALAAWGIQLAWACWWPVFLFQRSRSTPQLWMGPLDWRDLCANCWLALAGGTSSMVPEGWSSLSVFIWVGTVLSLWLCGGRAERLAAIGAGFPLAATIVYGLTVRNILGAKYLIFAQIFLLLGWSLLAVRLRWKPAQVGFAAALLAWSGFWSWNYAEHREYLASFPGVQGAVTYLEHWRRTDDPIIVGSPFVSIIVQKYATDPDGIYVRYAGDHRRDILGGPPLREAEYRDLEQHWGPGVDRLWTVDVYELFGPNSRFEVQLPKDWTLVRQEEFREANGIACVMAVREYQRKSPSNPTADAQVSN